MGYGGTKEEMERLLKDADALSDSFNLQVDESGKLIYSYADIVDAIHIVQDEMGIAGATAAEAATTIDGSANAMKASWQNLITGLANENSNMDELVGNFVSSFDTYLDNVLPRFEIAIYGIADLFEAIIPAFAERLPILITEIAPKLIDGGKNALLALVKGISQNAKALAKAFKDLVITGIDTIVEMIPELIEAATDILAEVIGSIPAIVSKLVTQLPNLITSIVGGAFRGVAKAFTAFFNPVYELSDEAKKNIKDAFSGSDSFLDTIKNAASKAVDVSKLLSEGGRTISEIDTEIETVEKNITEILRRQFADQEGLRQQDIDSLKQYKEQIRQLEQEKLEVYRSKVSAFTIGFSGDISSMSDTEIAQKIGEAQSLVNEANAILEESYQQAIVNTQNLLKSGSITEEQAELAIEKAKNYRDAQIAVNDSLLAETLNIALPKYESSMIQDIVDWNELLATPDRLWHDARVFGGEVREYAINLFKELDLSSTETFLNLQAKIIDAGGDVSASAKYIIDKVIETFDALPESADPITKEYLLNMVDGLTESIPELNNAADMTVDEILSVLKSKFSDFEQSGNDAAAAFGSGLVSGIASFGSNIGSVISNVFNGVIPTQTINGSHRNGLSYVPFDGYIAELHEGERVLTKGEARNYGTVSYGDINIVVNAANYSDETSIAEAIADQLQNMMERRAAIYA